MVQKSFPVRYMVVDSWFGWKVIDTALSLHTGVEVVCRTRFLSDAHRIARLLNKAEGYEYNP